MESKKNIWRFWDESLGSLEEYERTLPQRLFQEYGELLKEQTDGLLSYDIVPVIEQSFTLSTRIQFYITVPVSTKIKKRNIYESEFYGYRVLFFESTYTYDKVYPCKFQSLISENRYEASNFDDLREKIEKEIQDDKTGRSIANLLYCFYDEDTIKKLKKMSD